MTDHEPPTADHDASLPSNPATYHEQARYPLDRGQVAYDIRELVTTTDPRKEPGAVVVLDTHPPDETDIHSETFEQDDGTVIPLSAYHLNRLYGNFEVSERVVTIAWASTMDQLVPQWREHRDDPDAMTQLIDDLAADWDVSVRAHGRTYSYPESRLIAEVDVPVEVTHE